MLDNQGRFHSANGKRQVLIAEDEFINREMLRGYLEDEFDLLFAENGEQALRQMREHQGTLALVLLDLLMPVMGGIEVLRRVKDDPEIGHIPIVVVTADQNAEVESLTLGASDFIPKPYPQAGVILARVKKSIELSEDREIISSTERDPLTGLLNREYFYRYAESYDRHHPGLSMDAIVLDINHFHMINERFGAAFGDKVLRRIGETLKNIALGSNGLACRRSGDTFMLYCPHGQNYEDLLEQASFGIQRDGVEEIRVRLRMGVYSEVNKELDIDRRFDRAKMAADTVQGRFTKRIGFYDNALHEHELYTEQLVDDFQAAIEQRQFHVYYQPKFDIQSEVPVLVSAEALVRWVHPEFGTISPGVFIPLFESTGLIEELDKYVWREAAGQMRDWKERLGFTVPVSVNVSRVDMYDPYLVNTLQGIVNACGLSTRELLLEITESAYTQDSGQIIETVDHLRELGFRIEMDDFGTGYSSLNMISTLPIDVLKLDMQFIRTAFSERKDTKMLEVIIDIADYLGVPIVAEGVETEEQLLALKAMGCDYVQGFYFSRPVPANEYEAFLRERKLQTGMVRPAGESASSDAEEQEKTAAGRIAYALSSGYEAIYYVDTTTDSYIGFSSPGRYGDLGIETSGEDFFGDTQRNISHVVFEDDRERLSLALQKGTLLASLSAARPFSIAYRLVIDGQPLFYSLKAARTYTHDNHHIVIGVSNIDNLIREAGGEPILHVGDITHETIAEALAVDYVTVYCVNLDTDRFVEFSSHARWKEFGIPESGEDFFATSRANAARMICPDDLSFFISSFTKENVTKRLARASSYTLTYRLMLGEEPVYVHLKATRMQGPDNQYLVVGVSDVDAQIRNEHLHAKAMRIANRDALTGVRSKYAYTEDERALNQALSMGEVEPFAVVVCDVNNLKQVNDMRGHQAGDGYIKDMAHAICHVFDHSPVYRIGGDEFVAILRGGDYQIRASLVEQLAGCQVGDRAYDYEPIAVGMAEFRPGEDTTLASVFRRADVAMYEHKDSQNQGA